MYTAELARESLKYNTVQSFLIETLRIRTLVKKLVSKIAAQFIYCFEALIKDTFRFGCLITQHF